MLSYAKLDERVADAPFSPKESMSDDTLFAYSCEACGHATRGQFRPWRSRSANETVCIGSVWELRNRLGCCGRFLDGVLSQKIAPYVRSGTRYRVAVYLVAKLGREVGVADDGHALKPHTRCKCMTHHGPSRFRTQCATLIQDTSRAVPDGYTQLPMQGQDRSSSRWLTWP